MDQRAGERPPWGHVVDGVAVRQVSLQHNLLGGLAIAADPYTHNAF
ncbi:uncharacterized protein METZ01_LOCUS158061 [marine metagenome]|uniref:Uncharacterized protein n=1 Tax=marine metagenome TaxID=408172 RepID=A0A382AW68_9ZZZZ|nr:hypothetical protein [Candidatus Latescibacterota bacterium]